MKIVNVIPITRGVFRDELSYFTALPVKIGAIVTIPLRGRSVEGLVSEVREAPELKLLIKSSAYPLKKITRVKHEQFFTLPFMSAVRQLVNYSATSFGATLKSLVSSTILSGKISSPKIETVEIKTKAKERFVLQEPDEERQAYYKSLIRGKFATHGSVFLCLPTVVDITRTFVSLERGISEYTIALHNQLSTRELIHAWQKALDISHPVLIIATPTFLSLPRNDLQAIIVDRENTQTYKSFERPFIDYRRFAEYLANSLGITFVLGDTVLRTETAYRADQGELEPLASLKHHASSTAIQTLIEVKKVPQSDFRVISEELSTVISEAQKRNEKFFLFTHRRGLASVTICQDCGYTVECANCEAPTVLHPASKIEADGAKTVFVCHRCGARRSAAEKCRHCGGWRLMELGIGIDRVIRELMESFPTLNLFKIDSDSMKGGAMAVTTIKRFLATPGSVLVGTEMALYYLKEKIENVAVVALDSLFALPDYRINEKIFCLLIRLRALANKNFIIQTRNVKIGLFKNAIKGNLLDFYRTEIAERKQYGYPPFQTFIKVVRRGERGEVRLAMKALADQLSAYEPEVFPAFVPVVSREYQMHLLLKRRPVSWPESGLLEKLKSLPPNFLVDVDPDSLL